MKWFAETFPDYKKLPKSGKFMAWLALLQGVVWLALAAVQTASGLKDGIIWILLFWALVAAWGMFALFAAWDAFKCRASGFRKIAIVFAPCLFQIAVAGASFSFSFYLDSVLKLNFSFGLNNFAFGINVAALLFIILAVRNFRYINALPEQAEASAENENIEQGQETQS